MFKLGNIKFILLTFIFFVSTQNLLTKFRSLEPQEFFSSLLTQGHSEVDAVLVLVKNYRMSSKQIYSFLKTNKYPREKVYEIIREVCVVLKKEREEALLREQQRELFLREKLLPGLERIADGGEKIVYKGRFNNLDAAYLFYKLGTDFPIGMRREVIKQLLENIDFRFRNEIGALNLLSDFPNIINLYKSYDEDKVVILEYCPNSLDNFLKKGVVSTESKKRLISTILNGVFQMHSNNIVHNDLKPENIVFNDDLNAKIIDFCFAGHFDPEIGFYISPYRLGTAYYLAPEYFRYFAKNEGGEFIKTNDFGYTKSNDIFALGWVLNSVLTGESHITKFCRSNFMNIENINEFYGLDDYRSLIGVIDGASEFEIEMLELIKSCVSRNPELRPTIEEIRDRYEEVKIL